MLCPNCKNHIKENSNYCPKCGDKLKQDNIDHDKQYNYSELYSNIDQERVTSEEDYLKNYIGNNYNNIKPERFSIIAFIFGPFYLLSKKMWTQALLLLLIIIALAIQDLNISALCTIVINLYLGFKFNYMYLEFANRKIDEIKLSNPDKSSSELLELCKKKGTSNNALIALITIIILIILGMLTPIIFFMMEPSTENNTTNSNYYLNKMNYIIPSNFKSRDNNSNYYRYYSLIKDNDYCTISISTINNQKDANVFLDNYLKDINKEYNKISNKTINSIVWYYSSIDYDYHQEIIYTTSYDNNLYYIKYTSSKDAKCSNTYQEIINSIEFKN